ncbi:helix-turn-helix domain-containing protein [Pseudidiomarina homiensis]|nr:helix-turn-helix domain-containing protein [Pseudidiomarina homiensis]
MSNDTEINTTQGPQKSNVEMLNMDEVVARLRLYFGDESTASLMRRLGIPQSTYGNWRQRQNVTYDHLVQGLLRVGISLDWFFAPRQQLDYPRPSDLHVDEPIMLHYKPSSDTEEVLRATAEVKPFLRRYQLPETPRNQQLLVDTYLASRADHIGLDFALNQIALALSWQPDDTSDDED